VSLPAREWSPVCEQLTAGLGPDDELLVLCGTEADPVASADPPATSRWSPGESETIAPASAGRRRTVGRSEPATRSPRPASDYDDERAASTARAASRPLSSAPWIADHSV
jgi:hypothetical protein